MKWFQLAIPLVAVAASGCMSGDGNQGPYSAGPSASSSERSPRDSSPQGEDTSDAGGEDGTSAEEPYRPARTSTELESFGILEQRGGERALTLRLNGSSRLVLTEQDEAIAQLAQAGAEEKIITTFSYPSSRDVITAKGKMAKHIQAKLPEPMEQGPQGVPSAYDMPDNVYRYSCCEELPVRAAPNDAAEVLVNLQAGESVIVKQIQLDSSLLSVLEQAKGCNSLESCGSLLQNINPGDVNVYARVIAHWQGGVEGWVPLLSLFATPLSIEANDLQVQVGYGTIADAIHQALTAFLEPEGCETTNSKIGVSGQGTDKFWHQGSGTVYSCNEVLSCHDQEDEDGYVGDACPPGGALCTDCRMYHEAIFGPGGWYDQSRIDTQDCYDNTASCDYVIENYTYLCSHYVGLGHSKSFPRQDDYACGEYPLGLTHTFDDPNENQAYKLLLNKLFWGRAHPVKMGRLSHQKPITFTTFDLAKGKTTQVQSSQALGSKNLWLSLLPVHAQGLGNILNPNVDPNLEHTLQVHACAHVPGVKVVGPNVTYDLVAKPLLPIWKANFGTVDVDRVDFCARGRLYLTQNLEPKLEWTAITELKAAGLNVHNLDLTINPALGAAALGAAEAIPVFGHMIRKVLQQVLTAALALIESVDLLVEMAGEEWIWEDLVPESFKMKLFDKVLVQLNEQTASALEGAVPDVQERIDTLCEDLIPSVGPQNPVHFFYEYLRGQCQIARDSGELVPFMPHPGSVDAGCYGLTRFFTPHAAQQNNPPTWYTFEGQEWIGEGSDQGCRLNFELWAKLDQRLWPVLECMVAQGNLAFNQEGLGGNPVQAWAGNLSQACVDEAATAMWQLYGSGGDLADLMPDVGDWLP